MRQFLAGFALLSASMVVHSADAQSTVPPPAVVVPLKPDAAVHPFGFTRLYMKLNLGQEWASPHTGIFCFAGPKVAWKSGQVPVSSSLYLEAFRAEMRSAGFKVDGDQDNIFEQTGSTSDIQVGGIINDAEVSYCQPLIGYGNTNVKGHAVLSVQWQVYSTIQKSVIAKIETHGGVELKDTHPGGAEQLLVGAFRENVRNLINSLEFRSELAGNSASIEQVNNPTTLEPIGLAGAGQAAPRSLSEAIKSVVVVSAGTLQGSGFLVSSDGYILTDRHVVGDAQSVLIRWSDGVEAPGEVVRSDKMRDVALVKTDPRGRLPLKLGRAPLQPGDTVFAIGTPLNTKFQSTVTRGILSAYRTFGELKYIQSDVSVNPGSSGGPLLDDKGVVIGLTESGFRVGGAPVEINLFTPVDDALNSLRLTSRPLDQTQAVSPASSTAWSQPKMGSNGQAKANAAFEPAQTVSRPNSVVAPQIVAIEVSKDGSVREIADHH